MFEDNLLLKLVLKGVSNLNQQTDVRLSILLDILKKMISALPIITSSPYEVSLYSAMLSARFFGLLHPGEMVLLEHVLIATNMYISSTKVVCLLPTSKAHKGPIPQLVYLYKQQVDFTPINSGDLANMLCRLSEFLNLPHQLFKPHSLRISGSSHLHLSGVPVHKIKEIGRWSSDAFKKYIRV